MMPGMPERRTHDYARHGVVDLFAAFNIADGSVISKLYPQHRAVEFKKFLVAIDKAVPSELDVHLVCDNLATHKTDLVNDWIAKHPRFHMHFTPTGSSWCNQVERWFGRLTDQMLRRGVHKSVAALNKDIENWIENWNSDPKPFVWKKTDPRLTRQIYSTNFWRGALGIRGEGGVVDGEQQSVAADFAHRVEQCAGVEMAAGGEDEVVAEVGFRGRCRTGRTASGGLRAWRFRVRTPVPGRAAWR
jgi:transposase